MTTSPSNVALRGYQVAACEAIQRGFTEYQRQLLVLPTGGGKTVVFAHLAAINQPRRTLVLAHREELIGQAVDKIRAVTGLTAEVEMADSHASFNAPVVVASVQTLMRSSAARALAARSLRPRRRGRSASLARRQLPQHAAAFR